MVEVIQVQEEFLYVRTHNIFLPRGGLKDRESSWIFCLDLPFFCLEAVLFFFLVCKSGTDLFCFCFLFFSLTVLYSIMDELITQVCSKLNIDETVARRAIGAILVFLQEQVALYLGEGNNSKFDFQAAIIDKLKGALELMREAPKDPEQAKRQAERRMNNNNNDNATEEETTTKTPTTPKVITFPSIVIAILHYILTVGPIFDILKTIASTLFGEKAVQLLESSKDSTQLLQILQNLGISQETAQKMTTLLVSYMKEKVGPETMEKLGECACIKAISASQ
jgi:hypothetical protein